MKLTKSQEQQLVQLGFQKLMEMVNPPSKKPRVKTRKSKKYAWSEARKRKFSKAMRAKWKKLKSEK